MERPLPGHARMSQVGEEQKQRKRRRKRQPAKGKAFMDQRGAGRGGDEEE